VGPHVSRERGGVPIDLVLVAVVIAAVVGLAGWFVYDNGGWFWLLVGAIIGLATAAVMRPVSRRRRADDAKRRVVGHNSSWTSGKEEE
jgi:hypothetical protein